jgi:hypothetical protein
VILTLGIVGALVGCAFFGSLAFLAKGEIPAPEIDPEPVETQDQNDWKATDKDPVASA